MNTQFWSSEYEALALKALEMRDFSYTPYSRWNVGAALLAKDGRVFTGCNIENAAFGPTVCAERTAIFKAVSEGCREFEAIFIAGGPAGSRACPFCPPCGVCRQVMREFCSPGKFKVIVLSSDEEGNVTGHRLYTLEELLPDGFGPEDLR